MTPEAEARQAAWERAQARKRLEETKLLQTIAARKVELTALLEESSNHWGYEDPIYRFYHQSFKVFGLQEKTERIVATLQDLAPGLPMNVWFMEIVDQGTGKVFSIRDNENWSAVTRPIVEAFFHARYFLEMICRYAGEFHEPPNTIPSGWASVLYLYRLR
jgi:hypothetical protein